MDDYCDYCETDVYAEDIVATASRLSAKASKFNDCIHSDCFTTATDLAEDIRIMLDSIASSARKLSDCYPSKFGSDMCKLFDNYEHYDVNKLHSR